MKTASRFALALSTLSLLVGSATALAESRFGEVATKKVSFKDLDLSTAGGAQALYERITAAARTVCRGAELAEIHACRAQAVDGAVKEVGSPLLSSVHRSTVERGEKLVRR